MPVTDYKFLGRLESMDFVDAIYLFGSRAGANYSPRSDIDIAILCPETSRKDWLKVMEVIEYADTLLEIDCLRLDKLDDGMRREIPENGKVIYRKGDGGDD